MYEFPWVRRQCQVRQDALQGALRAYQAEPCTAQGRHLQLLLGRDYVTGKGTVGAALVSRALGALHQHGADQGEPLAEEMSPRVTFLFLCTKAGERYGIEALHLCPFVDIHQIGARSLLPSGEVLDQLVADNTFTGTIGEILALADLLENQRSGARA